MNYRASRHAQRGVTLVIGLIMLVLITLVVTTAFSLSNTNLKSVGNMQMRDEAMAASNSAIEILVGQISSDTPPIAGTGDARLADRSIDIDNDGTPDYTVTFDDPLQCMRASKAINESLSSVTVDESLTSSAHWNSIWEIAATATDDRSGARVRIREGIRVLLTQAQKDDLCS